MTSISSSPKNVKLTPYQREILQSFLEQEDPHMLLCHMSRRRQHSCNILINKGLLDYHPEGYTVTLSAAGRAALRPRAAGAPAAADDASDMDAVTALLHSMSESLALPTPARSATPTASEAAYVRTFTSKLEPGNCLYEYVDGKYVERGKVKKVEIFRRTAIIRLIDGTDDVAIIDCSVDYVWYVAIEPTTPAPATTAPRPADALTDDYDYGFMLDINEVPIPAWLISYLSTKASASFRKLVNLGYVEYGVLENKYELTDAGRHELSIITALKGGSK